MYADIKIITYFIFDWINIGNEYNIIFCIFNGLMGLQIIDIVLRIFIYWINTHHFTVERIHLSSTQNLKWIRSVHLSSVVFYYIRNRSVLLILPYPSYVIVMFSFR